MRVQRAEHALERSVREVLIGHLLLIHIILPDELQCAREDSDTPVASVVLPRLRDGLIDAHDPRGAEDNEEGEEGLREPLFHGAESITRLPDVNPRVSLFIPRWKGPPSGDV